MAFLEYNDKTSVRKKYARYVQGGTVEIGERFLRWWERRDDIEKNDITDLDFRITATYDRNPSLVAFDRYGRDDLDWFVLQYNNIVDINEEFTKGKIIKLPTKERVFYELLTRNVAPRRPPRRNR